VKLSREVMVTKKEIEEVKTDILVIYNNLYHVLHGDIEEEIRGMIRDVVEQQKKRLLRKYDLDTVLKIAKETLDEEEYAEFHTFMSERKTGGWKDDCD